MIAQNVKKLPVLDLADVEASEHYEAIRGFISKSGAAGNKSVIVVGLDGVSRIHNADVTPGKDLAAWLVGSAPAPDDAQVFVTDAMNVKQTFLELTAYTCPYGNEFKLYDAMLQDFGFIRNGRGNYWLTVGDGKSKTLFVAHLDTADSGKPKVVTQVQNDNGYVYTDGSTLLGADDKAGLTVLLYMIANKVAGHYLLVIGEEAGCIGSSDEAQHIEVGTYDRAVQFDRAGTTEVITHQLSRRTASREFARALCKQFKKHSKGVIRMEPSDRGVYTDTKEFTEVIKECTNVAVGYVNQHTGRESQDVFFLTTLAAACVEVEWEKLPTVQEYSSEATFKYGGQYKWDDGGDSAPWEVDTLYDALKNKGIWEVWGEIDSGDMSIDDLKLWMIYHPALASRVLLEMIKNYPTESLDVLTAIELRG